MASSQTPGTMVLTFQNNFVKVTHHSLPKSLARMYNRLLRTYIVCNGNYPDSCMQQHVHSLKTGLRNAPLLKLLQWHQLVYAMVRVICSVHFYTRPPEPYKVGREIPKASLYSRRTSKLQISANNIISSLMSENYYLSNGHHSITKSLLSQLHSTS